MTEQLCGFPECRRPTHSRGLCNGHRQQLNAGRVLTVLRSDVTVEERFWRLVDMAVPDGCWEWAGTKSRAGYGYFKKPVRKHIYAHRFSWELAYGPIPEGMYVCHRCDNPPCVNPRHLFLGTAQDNTDDCVAKGRKSNLPPLPRRGEAHGGARLTAKQVAEIRDAWAQPHGQRSGLGRRLAFEYGVSRQLISAIVTDRVWRSTL